MREDNVMVRVVVGHSHYYFENYVGEFFCLDRFELRLPSRENGLYCAQEVALFFVNNIFNLKGNCVLRSFAIF